MSKTLNFKLNVEIKDIINQIKLGLEEKGGELNGDEKHGTVCLPSPAGQINGEYIITGSNLELTITKKPMVVTMNKIEKEINKYIQES